MATTIRRAVFFLAPLALASCTAPPAPQVPPRFSDSRTRNDLTLVLPSAFCVADPETLAEYSADSGRRDAALGVGAMTGDLGTAYYRGEVPPSIEDARWFYLSCNPRRVLYFQPGRDGRRGR